MHYSESDFAWICKYIKKMDGFEERQFVAGLVVLELARLLKSTGFSPDQIQDIPELNLLIDVVNLLVQGYLSTDA